MKKIISLILAVVLTFTLTSCELLKKEPEVDPTTDNYRVFYQIFVGSFSDSNGDGIGDLRGIINRLDYLNDGDINSGDDLGVQGIWLSPIFSSPSYHKYDTTDYYKIDWRFGTEEDLKELIDKCHERNVKVILDLVINHTSKNNEWFTKFVEARQNNDTENEYYDFYSCVPLSERKNGIAYSSIPNSNGMCYECNFSTEMPELNFDNEAVRQRVLEVAKYYLDLGVDGFRFDAIKYIYFGDTKASSDFWAWYMEELKKIKPDIYCVGECWSADNETLEYIEALNCFNFQMAQGEGVIATAAKGGIVSKFTNYVESYQDRVQEANAEGFMIPFIANHDMDRAAGYLPLSNGRAHMAANMYLLCSGSPFIYYGEEIGLKGSRGSANTDANRRLAMLWGDEDRIKDPTGTTFDATKQTNGTVLSQQEDETSLLNRYKQLIALRIKYPEIARGEYTSVSFDETKFGGFKVDYQGSTLGIFHNTVQREIVIDLSTCHQDLGYNFTKLCEVIGEGAKLEGTTLTISGQTSVILK